jgi:hypothetical protein
VRDFLPFRPAVALVVFDPLVAFDTLLAFDLLAADVLPAVVFGAVAERFRAWVADAVGGEWRFFLDLAGVAASKEHARTATAKPARITLCT